jgi:serine/threonine protein kinase
MSPEQVRGHSLDCRTDLFSLGCVLYAMCTGRVPFDATTPMAQAVALATEEPVRVQKLNPEVPPALAELIADLLAKRPDDRPMSAEEVIDRLRTVNEPCEEQPPAESQQSFVRRHVVKFVALVWLVAAGLGAVALTRDSRPPQEQNLATPPAVPADPEVVYLVDLPRVDERIFPPPHLPQPPALTGPAVVGGVRRSHSVLVHGAPSFQQPTFIRYALDKKYSRFRAEVAMNDTASAWRTVSFVVQADGKELWRSPNLSRGQHPELCDLDVRNVNHLQLEIHTFGSEYGTHCVWIEPRLTK